MIRDRFDQTRRAVMELVTVKALISTEGEDWRPDDVRAPGVSDPTASKAIRYVDVMQERLDALRKREDELEDFIGLSLEIIEHVRIGLGDKYADVLDQRYIDCLAWRDVQLDGYRISASSGKHYVAVACDWIDALGLTRLLAGDYDV